MEKPAIKKERESGIELLRIILMIQVVFLHVSNFGKFTDMNLMLGGSREFIYWILMLMSRCPVYIFVMISGYFSVKSKVTMSDVWKRAVKVYLPMLFYSVAITCILALTGVVNDPSREDIIKTFLPFTSRTWYFMTNYLLVVILGPVVNIALMKLKKRDFMILLGVLFFIFSIWPFISEYGPVAEVVSQESIIESTGGKGLYEFLFMYIIGGYLRLHTKRKEKVEWKYLLLFFAIVAINLTIIYIKSAYKDAVMRNDNPFVVLQGICFFMFFRSIKFTSRIINRISSHNLGVYMIHEHFLMRPLIWDKLLTVTQTVSFYNSPYYLLVVAAICFGIYIVWALADVIRSAIFKGVSGIYLKIHQHRLCKKASDTQIS